MNSIEKNVEPINVKSTVELQYLEQLIRFGLRKYFPSDEFIAEPAIPPLDQWQLPLANFIWSNQLTIEEAILLLIGLVPHVQPDLFDTAIESVLPQGGNFPKLGGVRGKNTRSFLPTGETALFLLAGGDLETRLSMQRLLEADHFFSKEHILWLEELPIGEPLMSGKIIISQEYIERFTTGTISRPRFGINFPAQYLETLQEWDDLVLNEETMKQVEELKIWVKHHQTLLHEWGMHKKLKPGYKVLFHGPPGTGKTMTASLLGKYTGKDVYKIDLSMVVSKFIGETEKNLANLFDKAENKDWILFFDEADALFGKRTNVRDAHDKYANQEVSFLLQRIENYEGLVILATNFKSNIDDAFTRRFHAHIYFPPPKYQERLQLWQKTLPEKITLENHTELPVMARQYELTGAQIINIVQYVCLQAISKEESRILWSDLMEGIRKEYSKEGKIV